MAQHSAPPVEDVRGSGIYPATGPYPEADVPVRHPGELGRPARRAAADPRTMVEKTALVAGRLVFGTFFLYNSANHFTNRRMMTEYARSKGVPAPGVAVAATGAMLLAGGLSIMTGVRPKVGAGLIASFLLGVSVQMHAFWREREAQARLQEMVNFTKNLGLVGGSLIAAAHPEPWPWRVGSEPRG
jgi:putative oxidoreductase